MIFTSTLTLAEAALLLRTYPIDHEEAAAAWSARTGTMSIHRCRHADGVRGSPRGVDSEAARAAAADAA